MKQEHVVLVICCLFVGAALLLVAQSVVKSGTFQGWRLLPKYFVDARFRGPTDFDAARLTAAMQMAETCLLRHGKRWNAGAISSVCMTARVNVVSTNASRDLGGLGLKTPGVRGHAMQVGRQLAGVCHEMAHLCEVVLDEALDSDHSLWERDGIWVAVRAYEEWLIQQGWET